MEKNKLTAHELLIEQTVAPLLEKPLSLLDAILHETEFRERKRISAKSKIKMKRKALVRTKLALSDLMLAGSMKTGGLTSWIALPQTSLRSRVQACALGAALYAHVLLTRKTEEERATSIREFVHGLSDSDVFQEMRSAFPVLDSQASCPVHQCCFSSTRLQNIVMHLNDTHHWNRSKIAAWVSRREDEFNGIKTKYYKVLPLPQ